MKNSVHACLQTRMHAQSPKNIFFLFPWSVPGTKIALTLVEKEKKFFSHPSAVERKFFSYSQTFPFFFLFFSFFSQVVNSDDVSPRFPVTLISILSSSPSPQPPKAKKESLPKLLEKTSSKKPDTNHCRWFPARENYFPSLFLPPPYGKEEEGGEGKFNTEIRLFLLHWGNERTNCNGMREEYGKEGGESKKRYVKGLHQNHCREKKGLWLYGMTGFCACEH